MCQTHFASLTWSSRSFCVLLTAFSSSSICSICALSSAMDSSFGSICRRRSSILCSSTNRFFSSSTPPRF